MMTNKELDNLLDKCIEFHGHLCMGQILGVKIAVKGLELVKPESNKDLIVFVENDRCIADAIMIVSNTRLGRRSLKFRDYGKMAGTFINTKTNCAYRVFVKMKQEQKTEDTDVRKYLYVNDEDIVSWYPVNVTMHENELPGRPKRVVACVKCGEKIFDGKDIQVNGESVCMPCNSGAYFKPVNN
jgi:formylmethanofuran dehydrogenase subunit E